MDKANGKTKNTRDAESIFFCKRIPAMMSVRYDTDILEILGVLKKMSPKLKKVALEQIKALSSVC